MGRTTHPRPGRHVHASPEAPDAAAPYRRRESTVEDAMSVDATMPRVGGRAVVVGAGLAGTSAAAALARRFDEVVVGDRDGLAPGADPRRGVPQGRHAHLLLPGGLRGLDSLLPGFVDELEGRGAHLIGAPDFRFHLGGGRLAFGDPELAITGATRPLIEDVVRSRVTDLPGVGLLPGRDVIGLIGGPGGREVTGVLIRRRDEPTDTAPLHADLVVDATGRGSRSPRWLDDLGSPAPADERLDVGVH
jgi:2-polyprenyl-6-methoxyphenol hydroxylase-like FAD-dependent oxidoreductase